jgi:recombination protein RecT
MKQNKNNNLSGAAKASLNKQVQLRNQAGTEIDQVKQPKEYLMGLMERSEKQFLKLLSNDSKAVQRLYRVTMTYISKNPKLLECAPETVIGCMLISSELGLEFGFLGQAHMVPFYNNKPGVKRLEAQFIPGYQGLMLMAQRTGSIVNTYSSVVYEGDKFHYEYGMNSDLRHIPSEDPKKGRKRKCCYAYAKTTSGFYFTVLSMTDLEKIRSFSKSSDSPAWKEWTDEMYEKTAFRKLTKLLPKEASLEHLKLWKASILDDAAQQGLSQHLDPNAFDDMDGMLIDDKRIYTEVEVPQTDKQLLKESENNRKTKSLKEHITGETEDLFDPNDFNNPSWYIGKIEAAANQETLDSFLDSNQKNLECFGDKDLQLINRVVDSQREKFRKANADG